MRRLAIALSAAALLAGCAVNPVTGRSELRLVSTAQEIETGTRAYLPARQMQGGDYVADPQLLAYVREVGRRIAAVADRRLPYEFTIVNDGTPNAWAMPGGKIAVHRGLLLELGSEAELAAVLGHEVVHAAARHGAKAMERGLLLQGAVLAVAAGAAERGSAPLLVGGARLAAGLLNLRYSREAELEADRYGALYMARAGYDPRAAVSLQETFVRLSKGRRKDLLARLFATHPPSEARVRALRAWVATLPQGGELGTERYQARTERLRRTAPAYAAWSRGRETLARGDPAAALREAERALAIEPAEALFHALRGDALAALGRRREARTAYDRAVAANPGYYYPRLRRGLLLRELGEREAARADLEASNRLLRTAAALRALGELALAQGRREEAVRLLAEAAGADDPEGRAAYATLARIDLPHRPGRYLPVRIGRGRSGRVLVELRNPTPVAVADVVVRIRAPAADGVRILAQRLPGTLPPGGRRLVDPGLGPLPDAALAALRAEVVAARVAAP
ncbi:M48 family metalloprotease [Inmirania thermothiophila]|uniref:Putative Zn-dependent protease n=1 Tax=Inmirania thermothiophila TaxID=1750597 RepID=A0A3N1Y7C6_9GAMM|nr:M48 family metalloprotease [Inmirania thermothiophila]ROR34421.1 putative Zn-dependent protease [Inmirania thermothiophila]